MADQIGGNAAKFLRDIVERIERQEEEKKAIAEDIKVTYLEAKVAGFEPKGRRKLIALRKMDPADREELDAHMSLYQRALGMAPDDGSELV